MSLENIHSSAFHKERIKYLVIITGNGEILIIIMSTNTDVCFPCQPLFEMQ